MYNELLYILLNPTGKHCEGLPDTSVIFDENEVDYNPTKKKTKLWKKVGKNSIKALKFTSQHMPDEFKDKVNQSKKSKKQIPQSPHYVIFCVIWLQIVTSAETAAESVIGAKLMVPTKFVAKYLCDHPEVVKKIYTLSIGAIKRIIKNRKENENITEPELEKTANVVFIDLLKSNKKFIAESTETIKDPTDAGKIFRKPITSF